MMNYLKKKYLNFFESCFLAPHSMSNCSIMLKVSKRFYNSATNSMIEFIEEPSFIIAKCLQIHQSQSILHAIHACLRLKFSSILHLKYHPLQVSKVAG